MTTTRTTPTPTPTPASRPRPVRRFLRHLAEMLIAMLVGMLVLHPVWMLALAGLGRSDLLDRPVPATLVMATNMALGMAAWMRLRGHAWPGVAEMAAAMYVPFVVLYPPLLAGLISADLLIVAGHVLMIPAMLAVMLRRRAEYTGDHRDHVQGAGHVGPDA